MQGTSRWLIAILASTAMSAALAQQPPAAGSKPDAPASQQTRPEDLEPAVDTSTLEPAVDTSATAPDSATDRTGTSPDSIDPAVDTSATTPAPSAATAPNAGANPTAPGATGTPARTNRGTGRALDRLELDTTQITGNRELPKVLYIVPWKRADLGDLVGKPVNSLLDEVLTPVDRDVFRRENRYYRSLQGATEAGSASGAAAGTGPEK
jgi:hypothetical protein